MAYSARPVLLDDRGVDPESLPGTKQAGGQKLISFDEVAKHNKRDDCWVIIDVSPTIGAYQPEADPKGNVYDVTDFIESHPGGEGIIIANAGKDAT